MPTCPNGHQSGSDDWCEVCGHRMTGQAPAGSVPQPPPPPPAAPGYGFPPAPAPGRGPDPTVQAQLCPQCRTPREPMAPFCEECRWNFLTNTATSYTPLAPQGGGGRPTGAVPGVNLPPGFQSQGPPRQPDPYEYQGSRPSQLNRPAEPLAPEQGPQGPQGPQQGGPHAPQHGSPQGPPPPSAFQRPGPPQPGQPGQPQQGPHQGDPHRQGPPPPPPYQHQGPPLPPVFQQQSSAPPAPPQSRGTAEDDWMLPPPSAGQSPLPQHGPPSPQHGPPPSAYAPPAGWTAVVGPDREYFMAMMQRSGPEATGLNLPAYSPEQRLTLDGNQLTIGRRRHSTGESPDIDLSVPPEDPGVSHQHAVLVRQPDGTWAVVDQNSTNGTTINGAEDPIQPYVPVPLSDGDRVHVGAWTTITVRRG
ncbi:FHA domain-containing protein [Streptomyces liangshanensis]|uniref:FHA domain-containing protein n=1 Tax=Streptomyces liangshanensis TaxID=2717324 RepID=A0A6G9H2Q6_9ACTN|nr:FHA domain-containing protein [Streptomyces liangshanensis]QIQ04785.1 FHA domain-containing protein [Streptomyces liangshanensis]